MSLACLNGREWNLKCDIAVSITLETRPLLGFAQHIKPRDIDPVLNITNTIHIHIHSSQSYHILEVYPASNLEIRADIRSLRTNMPLKCTATDCRVCKYKRDCASTVSPRCPGNAVSHDDDKASLLSFELLLPRTSSNASLVLETMVEETSLAPKAAADARGNNEIFTETLGEEDEGEKEDDEDTNLPSPSSVYSNDSPLDNKDNKDISNDSNNFDFLDDVSRGITAWLDTCDFLSWRTWGIY